MLNDKNYELNYEELLDLTSKISQHQQCINSLMTEICKQLYGLSLDIMIDKLIVTKREYNNLNHNIFYKW